MSVVQVRATGPISSIIISVEVQSSVDI